jgi:hypothetical protein
VFTAARRVHEPFAVVNADDVYGAASFATLGAFLAASPTGAPSAYGLAAFPLRDTLSDAGPVNRAVCETDADGWLVRIVERAGVTRADAHGVEGGALVSMNLWGFTPAIFLQLEELLRVFLRAHGANATAEFLLPNAIQSLVHAHRARVRVLQAGGAWCGVTYAADAARVSRHLASLVERGDYPRALWG